MKDEQIRSAAEAYVEETCWNWDSTGPSHGDVEDAYAAGLRNGVEAARQQVVVVNADHVREALPRLTLKDLEERIADRLKFVKIMKDPSDLPEIVKGIAVDEADRRDDMIDELIAQLAGVAQSRVAVTDFEPWAVLIPPGVLPVKVAIYGPAGTSTMRLDAERVTVRFGEHREEEG